MEAADRPKVAFVTGASRGIGRLLALSLADTGATVVGFARPSQALDSLAEEGDSGSMIHTRSVEVTSPVDVRSAFEQAAIEIGPPNLLITCAGSATALGPISTIDPEDWWRDVTTDLLGTMLCVQAVLDPMLRAGSGHIITVYGNLGDHGGELVGSGVVALAIHPGFVRTPMTERLAWSEEGQHWLPDFKPHAEQHWGDGASAIAVVERIIAGEADELAGRVVHAGDDFEQLSRRTRTDEDLRRLRLRFDL